MKRKQMIVNSFFLSSRSSVGTEWFLLSKNKMRKHFKRRAGSGVVRRRIPQARIVFEHKREKQ